jgi:hypothetical protein
VEIDRSGVRRPRQLAPGIETGVIQSDQRGRGPRHVFGLEAEVEVADHAGAKLRFLRGEKVDRALEQDRLDAGGVECRDRLEKLPAQAAVPFAILLVKEG